MIPSQLKYTVDGSTPSFTDNAEQTVERNSQVRLRIKGIRGEMSEMFAIGSIREDYLGYGLTCYSHLLLLTSTQTFASIVTTLLKRSLQRSGYQKVRSWETLRLCRIMTYKQRGVPVRSSVSQLDFRVHLRMVAEYMNFLQRYPCSDACPSCAFLYSSE